MIVLRKWCCYAITIGVGASSYDAEGIEKSKAINVALNFIVIEKTL